MAQKVITVILGLIIVGGLVWFFNKNYLQPSESQVKSELPTYQGSEFEQTLGKLVYVSDGIVKEIFQVNQKKETQKIFTDSDESEKVIKFSNLASLTHEVFAIISTGSSNLVGKLVAINLDTAKKETLVKSFAVPEYWAISSDGKKISYIKFSNVEESYGYTLYVVDRTGINIRELLNSNSEIKSPAISSDSSKIAYVKISGTKSEIGIINFDDPKESIITSFENQVINWLSWADSDKLIISVNNPDQKNVSEIQIVDSTGKNSENIIVNDGGIANFAYLYGNSLGYLVAQYKDKVDDSTAGQAYIYDIKNQDKISLGKVIKILGWLP